MSKIITLLFTFCVIDSFQPTGSCKVLMDPDFKGTIKLYHSADKAGTVKLLSHDFKKEDFIYFTILKSNSSMFYVSANYSLNGHIANGWIDKNNACLGIYSRVYQHNDSLILYSTPDKSHKKFVVKEYTPNLIRVVDCKNNWLKVILTSEKKTHEGWISPEVQCANPYTTCA